MKSRARYNRYIAIAKKLGAQDALLISSHDVITAPWVRLKCQYGCGGYGQRLTCPPFSPTPEQTAQVLADYHTAILIHGNQHTDISRIAADLERIVFLDGHYKAFAFGSGPCRLCDACSLKQKDCRHPEQSRPSMEASGIDVFGTVRRAGFPIDVVKDHHAPQNYYGLVLID